MVSKKVFILFAVGVLFVYIGIVVGNSSKDSSSKKGLIQHKKPVSKTLSSNIPSPSTLGSKESSTSANIAKTEVLITRVLDGDTIETSSGERIRYIGINSPEKGQPFSSSATALNKELVLSKNVQLELDVQKKDKYGRILAYVFVQNLFVNLEMVKKGLAVLETIQPNVAHQDKILEAQKEARENCLGTWKALCHQNSSNTSGAAFTNCVKIESIHADAPGNDNQNKNGEWVKIKNSCSKSVSLDKWLLKDSSASNKYQFNNFSLDALKNVLLYSGCGQDSSDKIYWKCPEGKYAIWNNSGDHAFLYNEKGELVSDYQY